MGIRMAGLVGGRVTVSGRAVAEPSKTLQIQCSPHPHPQGGESTVLRITAMKKSENEMIKTGKQGKH